MATWCQCCDCRHFIADTVGGGDGVGECAEYEAYKKKKPSPKQLDKAYRLLGNKSFFGGNNGVLDRYCDKYLSKD